MDSIDLLKLAVIIVLRFLQYPLDGQDRSPLSHSLNSVLEITIPITPAEHPLLKFVGILKDDSMFAEWHDRFWAEKQQIDEDEEILTVEEMLRMG